MSIDNFMLNSLPSADFDLLAPHLQLVDLAQGEVLLFTREPIQSVYFPTNALLSWVHSTIEGETVEVGMTGFEGMVGTSLLLNQDTTPWQVEVQLAGQAFKLSTHSFVNALNQSVVLRQKVMAFTYLKMVQLTQSALCNRFHPLEQRLCRWLLAANDRVKTPEFLLTRDMLSTMIGSTRPAVSIVTGTLQTAGLIHATRGKITLLNREEMEEATCECYHVVKREFDRYLQA